MMGQPNMADDFAREAAAALDDADRATEEARRHFGRAWQALRQAHALGLSVRHLAEVTGRSKSEVGRIVRGAQGSHNVKKPAGGPAPSDAQRVVPRDAQRSR